MRARRELSVDHVLRSAETLAGIRWNPAKDDVRLVGVWRLVADITAAGGRDAARLQALRLDLSRLLAASIAIEGVGPALPAVSLDSDPLFVIGFGRTGSTFIHNLLALDPKTHAPRLWELWYPVPPPRPETYDSDGRIALARSMIDYFDRTAPQIRQIHPLDPEGPDECHHLMLHTTHLAMMYDAPDYWEWLKQLDDPALYRLFTDYRSQVNYLQQYFPGRRWVSKALAHLHYLPVLLDVFPNAKIIRLHRNPCELIPSLCSLYGNLRKLFQDSVDPGRVAAMVCDVFQHGMGRMIRAETAATAGNYIDIDFRELTIDPIGTVAKVYARFGFDYSAAFERAMQHYLSTSPQAMRSKHSYQLEEFGLTRRGLLDRSAEYLEWLEDRTGLSLVG